jgi:hypothetical protein
MKKRIVTVIAAALALLTLTAVSNAAAPTVSGGVLVRTDGGYIITGTLRNADSQVVGSLHGTLAEETTGFISCPFTGTNRSFCGFEEPTPGVPPYNCNVLGGHVTLNFRGRSYEGFVQGDASGHQDSYLCRDTPTTYGLSTFIWSQTHTIPGDFPDVFQLTGGVQQITPRLFTWSGFWGCSCFSGPPV